MKSPSIQVNKDEYNKDKKLSPKITSPVPELINIQDGNIGLRLQVPRGGTHLNGVGSELTIWPLRAGDRIWAGAWHLPTPFLVCQPDTSPALQAAGCALSADVKQSADIPALLVCRPRLLCRVRCPSLLVHWRAVPLRGCSEVTDQWPPCAVTPLEDAHRDGLW